MSDKMWCPHEGCRAELRVVLTAYGERASCFSCDTRWTRIRGEYYWTAERR